METTPIDVSDEVLALFAQTRLHTRSKAEQVQAALAIHLYLEEVISIGKAAELSGVPRFEFEDLLVEVDLPVARYGEREWEQDQRAIEKLRKLDLPRP